MRSSRWLRSGADLGARCGLRLAALWRGVGAARSGVMLSVATDVCIRGSVVGTSVLNPPRSQIQAIAAAIATMARANAPRRSREVIGSDEVGYQHQGYQQRGHVADYEQQHAGRAGAERATV